MGREKESVCISTHYHELCTELYTLSHSPLNYSFPMLFLSVVSRRACLHEGGLFKKQSAMWNTSSGLPVTTETESLQTAPHGLYLANDASGCTQWNLLVEIFISMYSLIKFADALSMEYLLFYLKNCTVLLEFSNVQFRIRELTHFSTEQSSMYLNIMGGKVL